MDHTDTLADFNRAIAQEPENSWTIAHRGELYRRMARYEAALADFDQAIALNAAYAWAFAQRGETYRLLKRYADALTDFNRAIVLKPDYTWAIAHRGETYRLVDRYADALADFDRALELNPNYAWIFACRCLLYEQTRRYEESLQDLDRTVALDETIFSAWRSDRGLLLSFCGRYAEAIAWCEQCLAETPNDPLLLYALAVTSSRWQGVAETRLQIDQAQAALQAALPADTTGAIFYRLGGLAALQGNHDRALRYLRDAINLRGDRFETACHDLAWLELRSDARFRALITKI